MSVIPPPADLSITPPQDVLVQPGVAERLLSVRDEIADLAARQDRLLDLVGLGTKPETSWLDLFNGYIAVLITAFLVTVLATPILRRLAVANGVIDRPSDPRKIHRMPIAYLGGAAVYLGLMAGVFVSYIATRVDGIIGFHTPPELTVEGYPLPVPPWVILGFTTIMIVGLIDDVTGISPRVKVGGQLLAAAFLAWGDFGVKLAAGVLKPTLGALLDNNDLVWFIPLPDPIPLVGAQLELDLIYWTGTAVIAIFTLGACNASNLIDGLDGLLSGVTGIATLGLLAISMMIVFDESAAGRLDSARIILCMALLGACLGFLPHNFNPATIFLGDCGSLLLGFSTIVIVLSLGDTGRTDLVIAGLIVYAIPIIDTVLAIIRRKTSGKKMSDPDSDHLHHMLKRALGVKGAVLSLYGIGIGFAALGVIIAASGARLVYSIALLFAAFIVVYSMKIARMKQIQQQALSYDAQPAGPSPTQTEPPADAPAEQPEPATTP